MGKMKDLPAGSEREKLFVLEGFETELRLPTGRSYTRVFTVLQVKPYYFSESDLSVQLTLPSCIYVNNYLYYSSKMDPKKATKLPQSIDVNAPISISYVNEADDIQRVYLRSKNRTLFTIEKPSAFDIYRYLTGCYYCFDRSYSVASGGMMDFLDYAVLQRENLENKSSVLKELKKKFRNEV
jgi:hypothetical protein